MNLLFTVLLSTTWKHITIGSEVQIAWYDFYKHTPKQMENN